MTEKAASGKTQQGNLFYEDIWDAIQKMVHGNAHHYSMKQVASLLWPAKKPETARNSLSRAISEDYPEMNPDPGEIVKLMEITGRPEDLIYFFCDKFGFERPPKKTRDSLKKELMAQFAGLQSMLLDLNRKIEKVQDE